MKLFNFKSKSKEKLLPAPLAPATDAKGYIKSLFGERKYFWLCFIIPALLMWLIYICMQVYPFGKESVLVLDLNGQYVYYFEELKNILSGDGSLLYSFSRALGGEFMGIFCYYLASPFSFLTALFPSSMMTEALLIMFLLKVGCCGFAFAVYADATGKRSPISTVIFSSMYALCAYAVVMQHNTMWIDSLIFLPLVMLGIENLIKFGRWRLYVISLSLTIYSNFYIGYMMCIFSALYFFYSFFSREPHERNPRGEHRHFPKSLGRMAGFSALSVALCALTILCAYYSLSFGKTEFTTPNYAFNQKFDWMDMLTKFYFGSYDTVRPEGYPWLYTGMLTVILAPLYFFAPKIRTREKIASGVLIAAFFLSFNTTTVDIAWHGFQNPVWLNYRYSFMLCFFLVLLAYKAYSQLAEIGYRKVIGMCGIAAGTLIVIQKLDYKYINDLTCVWVSLLICAIYLCVLRTATSPDKELRKTGALVLSVLCCLELFCAGLLNLVYLDNDVSFSSRTSYRTFIDRVSPVVEKIKEGDSGFYRMEKTVHKKTNDPYALDMNGMSGSTSTLNRETITLLNKFGLSSKSHWSKYLGGTPVFNSLMGIKYMIGEKNSSFPLYDYMFTYNDDLKAFSNPNALSIAYGVDRKTASFNMGSNQYVNPFDRMNALVSAMLGSDETVSLFKAQEYSGAVPSNLNTANVTGHFKYTPVDKDATSSITYTLTVTDNDVLYCYFPSDYSRECNLFINGEKKGTYFGNETCRIVELGSFDIGEKVTVRLELQKENLYIKGNTDYFYYLDSEAYNEYMPLLGDSQYQITDFSETSFKGTINIKEGNELVFTSIAYDEGWNIYVDGEKVEPVKLLDGLIGFTTTAGEHTLEMRYMPSCFVIGSVISAVGLALLIFLWIYSNKRRAKLIAGGHAVYTPAEEETVLPLPDVFDSKESNETNESNADNGGNDA